MRNLAVVLAAGGGSRFTGPDHKLLAELDDVPIVQAAIDAVVEAAIGPVLVVTGAVDLRHIVDRYLGGSVTVTTAHNSEWDRGQATSLQLAVREAERMQCDSIVVGLGDQPFVRAESWRAVAAADATVAVAEYNGRRGNPVKLHRSIWAELPNDGDKGARVLIRLKPHLVQPVPCDGSDADIDTREDLQAWQNKSSTNSP